jgi:hypothetical protein
MPDKICEGSPAYGICEGSPAYGICEGSPAYGINVCVDMVGTYGRFVVEHQFPKRLLGFEQPYNAIGFRQYYACVLCNS